MGRPLGNPNDPEFQRDVLKHALSLLEHPAGPVLEDYPHDAAENGVEAAPLACPVNFVTRPREMSNTEKLLQSFESEVAVMQNWYDRACRKMGRSTTGVSGITPQETVRLYADFLTGDVHKIQLDGKKLSDLLRMATEDLKAYYLEAVSAQPGQPTDAKTLSDWFWGETYAALVINELRKTCLAREEKDLVIAGKLLLIPRNQIFRF